MTESTEKRYSVGELAAHVGGTVLGDTARPIVRCHGLMGAEPADITFVSNVKYMRQLATTEAGCVVVGRQVNEKSIRRDGKPPLTFIQTDDPYFAFRQIVVLIHGFRRHAAVGISPLASVASSARIGKNVNIYPFAYVGENVTIGDGCNIYSGVTIMDEVILGENCILYPSCTIYEQCMLGNRVILHAGVVIGSDGYGFATNKGVHHKIPQIGTVTLEDDVEIGGNSVLERAAMETTRIGMGTKLGNGVVIGHNCHIGQHNLLVSQVGIAGSTSTGHHVVLAGQVGVAGHLHIGNMVTAAAQTGIGGDIPEKQIVFGTPSMEIHQGKRAYTQLAHLPELVKRVRALETQVEKLKSANSDHSEVGG